MDDIDGPATASPPANLPRQSVGVGPILGDPNSDSEAQPPNAEQSAGKSSPAANSSIGTRLAQPWLQQPAR
jgi:hypothetical protein